MTTRYQSCVTTEGSHLHIEDNPHGYHLVFAGSLNPVLEYLEHLHIHERSNLSRDGVSPQVVSVLAVELQGVRDIPWNLYAELVAVVLLLPPRGSYPAICQTQHIWCPLGEGLLPQEVVFRSVLRCLIRQILLDGR